MGIFLFHFINLETTGRFSHTHTLTTAKILFPLLTNKNKKLKKNQRNDGDDDDDTEREMRETPAPPPPSPRVQRAWRHKKTTDSINNDVKFELLLY